MAAPGAQKTAKCEKMAKNCVFCPLITSKNGVSSQNHKIKVSFYIQCDMETLLVHLGLIWPQKVPKITPNLTKLRKFAF